jgi:hypothetical protein
MAFLRFESGSLINLEHITAIRSVVDCGISMVYLSLVDGTEIAISSDEKKAIETLLLKMSNGSIIDLKYFTNEKLN